MLSALKDVLAREGPHVPLVPGGPAVQLCEVVTRFVARRLVSKGGLGQPT